MDIEQIISAVHELDGALVLQPGPGGDAPELTWGDAFFYFAPDGRVPTAVQPYGTITTKNYPDDTACDLDRPGRWRVNVHVGRERAGELGVVRAPGKADGTRATSVPPSDGVPTDVLMSHPVYGHLGWVCVVDPDERTAGVVLTLLREAHDAARRRDERRRGAWSHGS
ncbi:DUF6194 family protein [Isoptericola halotolerans]|uniref:DUF6194 domain-containing protein n=1 Tax=Isoptericola halotolerans TaxID=300560 RepID=A0ABX2A2Q4_9MICO|nr:DUF6194 family protein [Isoptericola halotolerans]NOV97135.1 hypothetical protein [Isoptericola halotolerans]